MTIARRPGEPLLGNPDVSGKVLSSTTAGVRSWVGIIDADHRAAVTGIHGITRKGGSLFSVGLGGGALAKTTIDYAAAVGHAAGGENTTGRCALLGYAAGIANTTGFTTAVGYLAAGANTTGDITAFGYQAGRYLADGSTGNVTSSKGIYIGYDSKASAAGAANEIAIGYNAIGGGSNTVRLGSALVTAWLPGATNVCALGNSTTAFKELYLSDGTDEWKVTVNTSGVLTTTKV